MRERMVKRRVAPGSEFELERSVLCVPERRKEAGMCVDKRFEEPKEPKR
jgi:hypothetical protein